MTSKNDQTQEFSETLQTLVLTAQARAANGSAAWAEVAAVLERARAMVLSMPRQDEPAGR